MSITAPTCRTVKVIVFRGDRFGRFAKAFKQAVDDERRGLGPGPSTLDCLLHAGHAGVSLEGDLAVFGFNPNAPGVRPRDLLDRLSSGEAFSGIVLDDSSVFSQATAGGLSLISFEVVLPEPAFQQFKTNLDAERKKSQYKYGFPNGDGDCNCITWLERLGLPLFSGRIDEFFRSPGSSTNSKRRFGDCV
jgi:hypothetical protein